MALLINAGGASNFLGLGGISVVELYQGETRIRTVTITNDADDSPVVFADVDPVTITHAMWRANIQPSGNNLSIQSIDTWASPPTVSIALVAGSVDAAAGTFKVREDNVLGSETLTVNSNENVPFIEIFCKLNLASGETHKIRYVVIVRRAL